MAATRTQRVAGATALAVAIAAPAEGLRQWAYYCPAGVLSVCYGATESVDPTRKYSIAECKEMLDRDMRAAVEQVDRCVPGLPESVLAAFGDAAYNLGPRIACDTSSSTAARMLREGRIAEACRQLPRWNRATVAGVSVELPGLTKRRQQEMNLCLEGVNDG